MKAIPLIVTCASLSLAACSSGPDARTGTVLGGLGGAAAGGIIGHQSGRGLEGAAIGAGLGALGGNLIGGAQDERRERYYDRRDGRYYDERRSGRYYRGRNYYY